MKYYYIHIFYFIWNKYFSILITNCTTTMTTLINNDGKQIVKRFIRVYIKKCCSSPTCLIILKENVRNFHKLK